MNNPVVQRILNQVNQVVPVNPVAAQVALSQPVSLEELRLMFLAELSGPVIVKPSNPKVAIFNGVFDFVDWYGAHESEFSIEQRGPLKGLVDLRDSIVMSCNCKRQIAENHGREAFEAFWRGNFETDIMPRLLEVLKVDRILFGNFLAYPK